MALDQVVRLILGELCEGVGRHVAQLAVAVGLVLLRHVVLGDLRLMLVRLVEVHRIDNARIGLSDLEVLVVRQQSHEHCSDEEANVGRVGDQLVDVADYQRNQAGQLDQEVEDLRGRLVPEFDVVE